MNLNIKGKYYLLTTTVTAILTAILIIIKYFLSNYHQFYIKSYVVAFRIAETIQSKRVIWKCPAVHGTHLFYFGVPKRIIKMVVKMAVTVVPFYTIC